MHEQDIGCLEQSPVCTEQGPGHTEQGLGYTEQGPGRTDQSPGHTEQDSERQTSVFSGFSMVLSAQATKVPRCLKENPKMDQLSCHSK